MFHFKAMLIRSGKDCLVLHGWYHSDDGLFSEWFMARP